MDPIAPRPEERCTTQNVQRVIDEVGFGSFQIMMLCMTGGVMFAEGSEMLIMGSITTLLHDHWGLDPWVRGLMVSIVFIGFSLGNLLSGIIGDRYGRRPAILLSYLMIGGFGLATAAATGPVMMITFRFFVGVGCGIGFPSVYSLIPEVCPTQHRGTVSSLMIGFMPLGELYAAIGVLLIDPNLEGTTGHCELGYEPSIVGVVKEGAAYRSRCSWRTLCEWGALPAFIFFTFSFLFLYESPHWLASQGRTEEVEKILKTITVQNRMTSVLVPRFLSTHSARESMRSQQVTFAQAVAILFSSLYFATTVFMMFAHFTKDFCVFGLAYVFPQFFAAHGTYSPGIELTITASLALPGVLLAVLIMRWDAIGHIQAMSVTALASALCAVGMLEAAPDLLSSPMAYCVKFLTLAYFIVVVVYTAEVFEAAFRNTAVGLCTCVGRVGSIIAPLMFELTHHSSGGSFDIFLLCIITFLTTVGILCNFILTKETKGRSLGETEQVDLETKGEYGTMKEEKAS